MSTLKNGIAAFFLISLMFLAQGAVASRNFVLPGSVLGPTEVQSSEGTPELVVSRLLKLYPNPNSTDEVNIKGFTPKTQATILVKNAIGYIVMNEKAYISDERGEINIKINSLQQGHYYIGIKVDKAQVIKKLIKI
ncbi:T9SS type A sorting domain-containing protein [Rufibacter latericius]|nr:T9SS type A sorting domain-containing protein [Rufibacter latericius]